MQDNLENTLIQQSTSDIQEEILNNQQDYSENTLISQTTGDIHQETLNSQQDDLENTLIQQSNSKIHQEQLNSQIWEDSNQSDNSDNDSGEISNILPKEDTNEDSNQFNSEGCMELYLDNFIRQEGNNNLSLLQSHEQIVPILDDEISVGPTETFELRSYQLELYNKGKGKNSIIYLETGTGKTLVVMMMMYHQLCHFPKKTVVFVANTIILVEQQGMQLKLKIPRVAELLENEYPQINHKQYTKEICQKISIIHGNKGMDYYSTTSWTILQKDTSVFVMTPQVLLNCLRKGIFKIQDLSCLIFDECHAAVENHPYNYIMREFYFQNKIKSDQIELPQIIGTTASPVVKNPSNSKSDLTNTLLNLCANLDSTYLHVDELKIKQYLKEAKIQFKLYKPFLNNYSVEYGDESNEGIKILIQAMIDQKIYTEFTNIMKFLYFFQTELIKTDNLPQQIITQIYNQSIKKGLRILVDLGEYSYGLLLERIVNSLQEFIQKIQLKIQPQVKQIIDYFNLQRDSIFQRTRNVIDGCNDKLKQVLILLQQDLYQDVFNKNHTQKVNLSLIFTKTRNIAEFLSQTMNKFIEFHGLNNQLKVDYIIGHKQTNNAKKITDETKLLYFNEHELIEVQVVELKKQIRQDHFEGKTTFRVNQYTLPSIDFADKKYNISAQKEIIQKFRLQQIQILISTSVAEEGLDVPMCNFVINYNLLQSAKAFVQIKGRARQENSRFIIMIPNDSQEQSSVKKKEMIQQETRKIITELCQYEEKVKQAVKIIQKKQLNDTYYEQYIISTTGAVLNTNYSHQLITQFCYVFTLESGRQGAPIYTVTINYQQILNKQTFIAFVLLPYNIKQVLFQGNFQNSEANAKSSAALAAATYLFQEGYFNDNLQTAYSKDFGQYLGAYEDDINILQTQQYQEIMKKRSKQVIYQKSIGVLLTLRTIKNYYFQINANSLYFKDSRLFKIPMIIDKKKIYFFCNGETKNFIMNQCQFLKFYQILIDDLQCQEIQWQEYITQRQKYQQVLINNYSKEESVLITQKNSKYCFFLDENNGDIYLIKEAFQKFIQAKKSITFYVSLMEKLQLNLKKCNLLLESSQRENYILKNIQHYRQLLTISTNQFSHTLYQGQSFVNSEYYSGQQYLISDQKQDLFQAVCSSINVDKLDPLIAKIGKKLYAVIVAFQIYFEYIKFDLQVQQILLTHQLLKNRSKKFISPTHIKYQLVSEMEIFKFLHTTKTDNKITYIPGLEYTSNRQNDIPYDSISVRTLDLDLYKKIILSPFPYYVYLSKTQISTSFYHILGLTYNHKDFELKQTFSIIHSTGVLKNTQFKNLNEIIQVGEFLELNQQIFLKEQNNLQANYQILYDNLGYQFKRFNLLFQALTDASFRSKINQKLCPSFPKLSTFTTKNREVLTQSIIIDESEIKNLNSVDQTSYCNDHLAYLGEKIYLLICTLILQNMQQCRINYNFFKTALKALNSVCILGYLSARLQLPYFVNTENIKQMIKLNKVIDSMDQNDLLKILETLQGPGIVVIPIRTAFYAIIGAIYIDCDGNLGVMQTILQDLIFERYGLGVVFEQYIKQHPRYKFHEWYRQQFGNPADFDLIKVPHCNYSVKGYFNLYIPYDFQKEEIVNILGDKLKDVTQLHIYAQYKRGAWDLMQGLVGIE